MRASTSISAPPPHSTHLKQTMFASVLVASALASPFSDFQVSHKEFSLCSPCVQIGEQGLNLLLNEILNAGVIGGCGKLCHALPQGISRTGCDIVCAAVGIKTFIGILNKTDLDPIYYCEELKACPAGARGHGSSHAMCGHRGPHA